MKVKTNTYARLEKILTLAGLVLVITGCIANLYSAYVNMRFIHDPIDFIYYFKYVILLGGGFAAGYLLTKKSTQSAKYNRLFIGVVYAFLAMALFWLFDVMRVGLQNLFEYPSYPWGKIVFMGLPLFSVIVTLIGAFWLQYKPSRPNISPLAKGTIVISFIVYELYILVSSAYFLAIGDATYEASQPMWLVIGHYLINPLVIAIGSYLLLSNVKRLFARLFYAVLIGAFYATFTFAL